RLPELPEVARPGWLDHEHRPRGELLRDVAVEHRDRSRPRRLQRFLAHREVHERVGLEHLLEEQVAWSDKLDPANLAAGQRRDGAIVRRQRVLAIKRDGELASIRRSLVKSLVPAAVRSQLERDDVDDLVAELDLEPALDGLLRGVRDLDQDLVAD